MATTNNDIKTLKNFYEVLTTKGLRTQHMFQLQFSGTENPYITRLQNENFVVYANSANVPGRQIVNEAVPFYGFPFQVPVNTTYTQTWECNMRCDKNLEVRSIFEGWMDLISDLKKSTGGSKGMVPVNTYALVHLLSPDFFNEGSDATVVRTYKCVGIYPSNLGDMTNDHSSNAISTFATTFTFQYWYPYSTGDGAGEDPLG